MHEKNWNSLSASAGPADWMNRDMETWNRDVGEHLRAAYHDTLLALAAGAALGKAHRRVLAEPLLSEVNDLAESLGLT
ncbi:MAG: hypothetical protein ACRDIX_02550 [Actinomycetota bacterium]